MVKVSSEKCASSLKSKDWIGLMKREQNLSNKSMLFVSFFTLRLCEKDLNPPIVVGGHASAIYYPEYVTTQDIDLVVMNREESDSILRDIGFRQEQRAWTDQGTGLYVEIFSNGLSGSYSLVRTFEIQDVPVAVLGVEDLIVSRLVMAKFWKTPEVEDFADKMYGRWSKEIDTEYLGSLAKKQNVDDLLTAIIQEKKVSTKDGILP